MGSTLQAQAAVAGPPDRRVPSVPGASDRAATGADPDFLVRPALARLALFVYVTATLLFTLTQGLVLQRQAVVPWMMGLLVVGSLARGRSEMRALLRDWGLLLGFMLVYVFSQGVADSLGMPLQGAVLVDIDRVVGFGEVPTAWLQARLDATGEPAWWEVPIAVVYVSHFFVVFVVAAVLWLRNRKRFRQWLVRLVTLSMAGVVTYIAFPAMPPWYANDEGLVTGVDRITSQGWSYLGLGFAQDVFQWGHATLNPVAAVPSMHAAYAFLVFVFFAPGRHRLVQAALFVYAAMMGFTLVYTGEHWVFDVLVGWLYVAATVVFWDRRERRLAPDTTAGAEPDRERAAAVR
ncbi:MAG: phosphatase PAP2 family protein [Acidimicrobiales bacterium]